MSERHTADLKRLTKNTIYLYVRSFLVMLVALFTTRVILQNLGVEDYGIYNVVSSFVTMFSFISSSLSVTISRFLSIELAQNKTENVKKVYSSSLISLAVIALILAVIVELIGVPFLNLKMTIPAERLSAANWVLQFSIITLVINVFSIAYEAVIVSYEKMSIYAYISILDVVLKLLIAYVIAVTGGDKLIVYSFLLMMQAAIIRVVYGFFCRYKFEHCRLDIKSLEKSLVRQITTLSGWDVLGAASNIIKSSGTNIIFNLFLGPVVNAANGISEQVRSALWKFSGGFLTALRPQIVKAYSSDERQYLFNLINRGTKFSSYLMIILSVPIIVEIDYILNLWLHDVPQYTAGCVVLVIVLTIGEGTIAYPSNAAMMATGNIKKNQIIASVLQLMNLPLTYIIIRIGYSPYWAYIISICIANVLCLVRTIILNQLIGYSTRDFYLKVYLPIYIVFAVSLLIPYLFHLFLSAGILRLIIVSLIGVIWSLLVIMIFGCNKIERSLIVNFIRRK